MTAPSILYASPTSTIEWLIAPTGEPLVHFTGCIDEADPGAFLDPLLDGLHQRAVDERWPGLVADFTRLEFLNSSGIKALARWVLRQKADPAGAHYRITLRYASRFTWQRVSFKTLAMLSDTVQAELA
jgi:hypothetical protein